MSNEQEKINIFESLSQEARDQHAQSVAAYIKVSVEQSDERRKLLREIFDLPPEDSRPVE